MNRASRSLLLLLSLTVALASLLAYEAQRATRSHRVTAERALRDYATVAARELATASAEALEGIVGPALNPVVGSPAASPYDSLPPASAIVAAAEGILGCGGPETGRTYFALDFRTGTLSTAGAVPEAETAAWLRAAVGTAGGRAAIAWGHGSTAGRIAVYGVKSLRYSGFAGHDAPLAAYGLVTCSSALRPVIARVLEEHPLLPSSVSGGLSNAELAALDVRAPDGEPLFRFGPAAETAYAGDTATAGPGSPVFRAALPAAVAGRLVVARPTSRLPVLFGLLAVTAGLAAVALRQLRREQELARLRADFTSSVSHELRTPLTQILLFAETLELGRAGGEGERRQALEIIVQEARRLAHLVENVLHYSRAERRMLRVQLEERTLAPLLRETVHRFAPLTAGCARIDLELDERLVAAIHADSLRQIVINLLDNAVKYGSVDGAIGLRAALVADRARVEVDDMGPGIAPEDRAKVWEPFVRLHRPAAVPGSGIGLAVVRELVTAHRGACWVEAAPGGGARFVVELPRGRRIPSAEAA
ncbi:MAG: HAMP domain-containing histidine kinase [Gemmatimonadales bacterium]|nr:HAMP domain-containing histidine kinase [Gemmatimonadales bacterium]